MVNYFKHSLILSLDYDTALHLSVLDTAILSSLLNIRNSLI